MCRILALETSTRRASVAFADRDEIVLERRMLESDRTAVWLASVIADGLDELGWRRDSIELIALTTGPGSFTGLRIGVTTAKMLGYAWKVPIFEMDTLAVIAHQMPTARSLGVVMDARREQLFAARFCGEGDGGRKVKTPTQVVSISHWIESLDADSVVGGPAVSQLASQLPPGTRVAPSEDWHPTAATVASVAKSPGNLGQRTDAWTVLPRYFRPSYAERNLT